MPKLPIGIPVRVRLLDEDPDVVLTHIGSAFIDEAGCFLAFERRLGDA